MNEQPATRLEELMVELEELLRSHWGTKLHHDGLQFKTTNTYLTNEGFPLGTLCWWMRVYHDGYMPIIADRTAEGCVEKVIGFFKTVLDGPNGSQSFKRVREYMETLRG